MIPNLIIAATLTFVPAGEFRTRTSADSRGRQFEESAAESVESTKRIIRMLKDLNVDKQTIHRFEATLQKKQQLAGEPITVTTDAVMKMVKEQMPDASAQLLKRIEDRVKKELEARD